MFTIVVALFVAAALAPTLVRRTGRAAFLVLAVVPLVAFVWALGQTGTIRAGDRTTAVVSWVPSLGLELALSLGGLQWVLVLVVTGIGALVLGYCRWYFPADEAGLGSFAGVFMAFVGAMLGLVLADDLLLLFVFWELTTIFSYLLIGHDPAKASGRQAGMQALLVTTLGGLVMLVGILLLGQAAGTHRISDILASPPAPATTVTVAIALLLVGALTKSALLPFHFWLPGAMAAPTPVSAYLHAASMVKAGVYLVALLAPAFSTVPGWHPVLLTLGVGTMVLGGWRALRQFDIKLLLAYGTVSQLGLLVAVLAIGTRSAALAGLAILLAHALFKATLFLVVGIIDRTTGTRDLRELSGLGRARPLLLGVAVLGGLSMAGIAPLLGFVGKEGVYAAVLDVAGTGDGTPLPPWAGWALVTGIVVGSTLTVAYTARFLWGAFATKPDVDPTPGSDPAAGFVTAPVVLAALGLALAFVGGWLTDSLAAYSHLFAPGDHDSQLALWHGIGPPLALSLVSVAVGWLIFARRTQVAHLQALLTHPWSAERGYRGTMRGLDRGAVEITGLTQRGSVAAYLAVILLVVVLVPGAAVARGLAQELSWPALVVWDSPGQALTGVVIVLATVMATRSRRRLRAVILLGVAGYGTGLLFLLHGAPDLALTQVLVETVSLVVLVLVLRRLPAHFTDRPLTRSRYWRMALGAAVAVAVAGSMLLATGARIHDPVSLAFPEEAVDFGGGRNIVNVILVDLRAWDTLGELAVLVAAATGVASLIFLDSRLSGIRRVHEIPYPSGVEKQPTRPGRNVWLSASRTLAAERRSIVLEVVTRLLFHTIIVFSIYLLFTGHNNPGGGFAAGMVTGLALVVRYLAGGKYELDEAAPVDAGILIGTGLFLATVSGLAPLLLGGAVLQTAIVDVPLGPFGELHLVSSLGFDVGVYLVVVGLVLDLLRTFGSRIDRQIRREERDAEGVGR
ncbi:Na+/H+ antiporter subunit A [Nocardioides sp.]|uniref:Na+/H+ antiporter subunit A n=1 Tax=Nocardioides sp. TaxID=35761 RepID=UPI00273486B5|nr:Na+/H+ antiporter subunit A [Nocardioides sp.]MDP3893709.1 Na+/H+ antiporter subunit A [Nocardioides sp.]